MLNRFHVLLFLSFLLFSCFSYSQSYFDYELASVQFEGNNSFAESELKLVIESKESPMWFWIFLNSFTPFGDEKVFFDSSKTSLDKNALRDFYVANGYFQTEIKDSIIADSSGKSLILIYHINENQPSHYGKINLLGLEKISEYDYERIIGESLTIDSSKRYSEKEVLNNISSIRKFLSNTGYVFSNYDSTIVVVDTVNNLTNLELYFHTGDRHYISEIIIYKSGSSVASISNELIREIINIKPGEMYDQSKIDRSEFRLQKTELFTNLDINPVIADTSKFTIPLEVNAEIAPLNELAPDIKVDNEFSSFNAGLGLSYTRKNFFGSARKLSLSTSFRLIDVTNFNWENIFKSVDNRDSTFQGVFDFNLKLEQPFLFGRPILTTTEFYYRAQTLFDFTDKSYGAIQKLDFEMPTYTFITLLRPYLNLDASSRLTELKTPNEYSVDISSLTPGLGIELGSSKTNDLLFPTSGYFLFLTPEVFQSETEVKLSGPFIQQSLGVAEFSQKATTYFYRVQSGISFYAALNALRTSIFATKLRVGYIQTFSGGVDLIPPNKTFYAGGSNSVRGWRSRELVPKDTVQYFGISTGSDELRGGTFWLEGSFEYRKKLLQNFGVVLFTDYGNTWNGYKEVKIKDFAVAVGLGVRLYTPIAPFRLDFGTKFYNPEDQKFIFNKNFLKSLEFHFGIGEAF